jgi:hypothetical protein
VASLMTETRPEHFQSPVPIKIGFNSAPNRSGPEETRLQHSNNLRWTEVFG